MTPNNVKIQALMPDVGCAGGLPRSLPPRAARSAGVFAEKCNGALRGVPAGGVAEKP